MKCLKICLSIVIIIFASKSKVVDPWTANDPTKTDIRESSFNNNVKIGNAALSNNIGNFTILSQQINNLTKISQDLESATCYDITQIVKVLVPISYLILYLVYLFTRSSLTEFIHLIEFTQLLILTQFLNIVRDRCNYEFLLSFKTIFFVWSKRPNVYKNTTILKRIFWPSLYFLENSAEINFIIFGIVSIYLFLAALHLAIHQPNSKFSSNLNSLMKKLEFNFFLRLGQIFVLPMTYFCFFSFKVIAFTNKTLIFDFVMALIYATIIMIYLNFVMYLVNFYQIDLNDPIAQKRFGSIYLQTKYENGSKVIINAVLFKEIVKIFAGSLHSFGFFGVIGTVWTMIITYCTIVILLCISLFRNGVYKDFWNTYKIIICCSILAGNYAVLAAEINSKRAELRTVSYIVQIANTFAILLLYIHAIYALIKKISSKKTKAKNRKKEDLKIISKFITQEDHFSTDMSIFDDDKRLDQMANNRVLLNKNSMIKKDMSFLFNSDWNLKKINYDDSLMRSYRDELMTASTSNLKKYTPMNLIFNSILKKSNLNYYSESNEYKKKTNKYFEIGE